MSTNIIKRLDQNVINKIAAGEVIQRPYNAIKELIENSIDAGSTNISITIKDGGLKYISIHDNGTGIQKEDLIIACERFTTSKLTNYDDLNSLQTYGFRGEALASISFVSHLSIISKVSSSPCAYKCEYFEGKPKHPPKPCAGNQGTQIIIEDLFYNLMIRKNALKSFSQEYAKICDIIMKYAVHKYQVAFSLKKQNTQIADVRTLSTATPLEKIRNVYGAIIAKNLLKVEYSDENLYQFTLRAWLTHPNTLPSETTDNKHSTLFGSQNLPSTSNSGTPHTGSSNATRFLLFINNRLVQCIPLKKSIDSLYQECTGTGRPNSLKQNFGISQTALNYFAYIDLRIDPNNIDVNMHPSKSEVCFLHQDLIISKIRGICEKSFFPQSLAQETVITDLIKDSSLNPAENISANSNIADNDKPAVSEPKQADIIEFLDSSHSKILKSYSTTLAQKGSKNNFSDESSTFSAENASSFNTTMGTLKKVDESRSSSKRSVFNDRTDYKLQRIDTFFPLNTHSDSHNDEQQLSINNDASNIDELILSSNIKCKSPLRKTNTRKSIINSDAQELHSVKCLKDEIMKDINWNLTRCVREHVFVGCINPEFCLVQYSTGLFIANNRKLAETLYHQLILKNFGRMSPFRHEFLERYSIYELVMQALGDESRSGWESSHGSKEELAYFVQDLIVSKSSMLDDYFSLTILPRGCRSIDEDMTDEITNTESETTSREEYYLQTLPNILPGEFNFENETDEIKFECTASVDKTSVFIRNMAKELPFFLLSLATEVEWENEQDCFAALTFQLSQFLASKYTATTNFDDEDFPSNNKYVESILQKVCQNILYPSLKKHIYLPIKPYCSNLNHLNSNKNNNSLDTDDPETYLVKVADVKDLYKIFERC